MIRIGRRAVLGAALLAAPANAQAWPTPPVRIVVPFPPGGPADVLGRLLAERLAEGWGQPVIVENRGGAGGNIGAEVVARAAPDGHTLLLCASSHVQGAALYRRLPFDPIRDFTPIRARLLQPGAGGASAVPATDLAEFEALLRARPGAVHHHLRRRRDADAPDRRAVPQPRRGRVHPCALRRRGAGACRAARRPGAGDVPQPGDGGAGGAGRAAAGAGHHRRGARAWRCRMCRPWRNPAIPASISGTWYAVLGPAGLPAAGGGADRCRSPPHRRAALGAGPVWRRSPWSRAISGRRSWRL